MNDIFFYPWRGGHYGRRSPFGVPVMILGESHYGREAYAELTRDVVKRVICGRYKFNFFRNAAAAFLGEIPDEKQRWEFWNSVAFYNYVQELVGPDANTRPTGEMWSRAEFPFCKVIAQLKPSLIAVFGFDTWENTPCSERDATPIIIGGKRIPCYRFFLPGTKKTALAPRLRHPSRGFSFQEWHPVVLKMLERVGGHEWRGSKRITF